MFHVEHFAGTPTGLSVPRAFHVEHYQPNAQPLFHVEHSCGKMGL